MRIPFTGHRNEDQHGGVGSSAESHYATTSASRGAKARIPDGYPSVLIMQRHPETGKFGSFVYVHSTGAGPAGGTGFEVAEIDPVTGEILG